MISIEGPGTPRPSDLPGPEERPAALSRRYLDAQLRGDRRECLRLILEEGLGAGIPVPDLHLKVIAPAQREIGRLWQENRLSVAREHQATAISQLVLAHLYPHLERAPSNGRLVVVACIQGEEHDMGARMIGDFLEMAGFEVRFLGADVPTSSLLQLVGELKPHLLALSVMMPFNLPALEDAVGQLRARFGPDLLIAVGGHAFPDDPALRRRLGIQIYAADARGLILEVCRQLKV